jgi:translation initiation factor IF-1
MPLGPERLPAGLRATISGFRMAEPQPGVEFSFRDEACIHHERRGADRPATRTDDSHQIERKEPDTMNRFQTAVLTLGLSLALSGAALAQETKQPKPIRVSEKITMRATVEAIDPETPAVTVRTSDGSERSFRLKNKKYLKDVKVGDQVMITRTQGLMIEVGDSKQATDE